MLQKAFEGYILGHIRAYAAYDMLENLEMP